MKLRDLYRCNAEWGDDTIITIYADHIEKPFQIFCNTAAVVFGDCIVDMFGKDYARVRRDIK